MRNCFSIKIKKASEKQYPVKDHYLLPGDMSLTLNSSGPNKVINTDDFIYFRFGYLLAQECEAIDTAIANGLFNNQNEAVTANNGYFTILFFNKKTAEGRFYTDRIGAHKTYFQCKNKELHISNIPENYAFNNTDTIDPSWLVEAVNFKICTGSTTLNPDIKQIPAGHYYKFDSSLAPINAGFYWQVGNRKPTSSLSLDEATNESLRLINQHLESANVKSKKVAVLLSGGVDSSLLAALTKEHNNNVVAVTPIFSSGENPELKAAISMAKQINIEHQIVEISDSDISEEFGTIVDFIKQPIRSPQTIIFSILMRQFKDKFDAVVFGEGADMVFGYHAVKQAANRYEKYCKVAFLKPVAPFLTLFKSISTVKKLLDLLKEPLSAQVLNSWAIEYPPEIKCKLPGITSLPSELEIIQWLNLSNLNYKDVTKHEFENLIRRFIMQESCMYHFYTMGSIADRDGIELISPFFDTDVINFATNFDNHLYFGDEHTKPILRKLGERFYDKEIIYAKKKGFPVPHKRWLEGPLKEEAQLAKSFIATIYGEGATKNNEFVWLVMALQKLKIEKSIVPS